MHRYLFPALAAVVASLQPCIPAHARPGDVHADFGIAGGTFVELGSSNDVATAVALQADGKVVAAGCAQGASSQQAVVRLDPEGMPDAAFGSGAIVAGPEGCIHAVVVQPDGKLVTAGELHRDGNKYFALTRYLPDGSVDPAFSADPVGGAGGWFEALALQQDGRLVAAGSVRDGSDTNLAVVRYESDGRLDSTFGSGGIVTTQLPDDDWAQAVLVQPDGKILAGGFNGNFSTGNYQLLLVRYNADGTLDSSFGGDGIVTTSIWSGFEIVKDMALLPDGGVIVLTYNYSDFVLVRYRSDGSLDTGFGSGGVVTTNMTDGEDRGEALGIQPDGKILVAGIGSGSSERFLALARYHPNGTLDWDFGTGGKALMTFPNFLFVSSLALSPAGHVTIAGSYAVDGVDRDILVAQYLLRDDNNDLLPEPWDLTPNAFAFENVAAATPDSPQVSNMVTVAGLEPGASVPVRIRGGEYALNGSTTYTSAPGWVRNGDQINVRHTAAKTAGTGTSTTLSVGGLEPGGNHALILGTAHEATFASTTAATAGASSGGGGGGAMSIATLVFLV
ncbi:MAG: hypothetical protein AB7U81_15385, partial [Thiohalomonadaceae bacterium]